MQNANCAAMLQVALNTISDWAREWQLSISISKCNILSIGNYTPEVLYYIDENALPVVTSFRDLGVMLASDLSPSIHIGEIVRKAHQRANAILRCFETCDKELLVRTFTTYVRPLLEYNSVIWSPHLKRHRGY